MPFLSALYAISEMLSRCTIPSLSCHVMPFHDTISLMPSLSTAYIACDPVIHRLSSSAVLLTKCLSSASHVSRLRLTSLVCVSHLSSFMSRASYPMSHRPLLSLISHLALLCLISHFCVSCLTSRAACLSCVRHHISRACLMSPVSSLKSLVHASCLLRVAYGRRPLLSRLSFLSRVCLMSHISHLMTHISPLTSHMCVYRPIPSIMNRPYV